ncbi:MAG: monovalent cation/H+ antiporter subunit D family protein, partial [Gammaproteobacteria bacterium]|nr:monovalent cation/H+ antiporter subunit D family protein [Gammaproteobacteria bacterium]
MGPDGLMAAVLAVPTVGAVLVALGHRRPDLREGATLFTSVLLFLCVAALLPPVLDGARPTLELFPVMPGLPIAFALEPLGMLFALVASALWIVNSLYSIGYLRGNAEQHQTRFYVCFALAIAATMGIALAGNVFTLFVFYELLTLVTYPLVTHHGTEKARLGGRVYLGLLVGTSVLFFLPAIVFTWHVAGTTDFRPGGILAGLAPAATVGLLALYAFGIGKAALMPVHRWLPAAMVAPTPVSALLHAVAVVKAGVFSVVKVVVYVFGLTPLAGAGTEWLAALAGFTILAASLVALQADNLKRRLAYSTVSQLAYVVMATALLAPLSVIGAVVHIAAHALGKIT